MAMMKQVDERALAAAGTSVEHRGSEAVIHHSDQGGQYTFGKSVARPLLVKVAWPLLVKFVWPFLITRLFP